MVLGSVRKVVCGFPQAALNQRHSAVHTGGMELALACHIHIMGKHCVLYYGPIWYRVILSLYRREI